MTSQIANKKRPTISLCVIAKNEERNVEKFLTSFDGCVDEIIFVDTGSIDKTKELAAGFEKVKLFDFEWVNSFAKARNYAFSLASCDYVMWADLDDVLFNKEAFIQWRDYAMEFADMFFATYHYALEKDGTPIISFVRERVFKRSLNPTWQFDLHEGIVGKPEWSKDYAVTWAINHMRTMEDIKADKSRNIKILEEIKSTKGLDPRLWFYYGKELYEMGRLSDALTAFDHALTLQLEPHDRLLALQYGSYAALQSASQLRDEFTAEKKRLFDRGLDFCHHGIRLEPNRAEFHVTIGDIYLSQGMLIHAIPFYSAAKRCISSKDMGSPYEGAIYSFVDSYGLNPTNQLAKVYTHIGRIKEAKAEANEAIQKYDNQEAKNILAEIERIEKVTTIDNGQEEVPDIIFTTPPQTAYEFDEEIYKTRPLGGSETALVCMAKHLKEKTNLNVKVFNMRSKDIVAESGVEYISNARLNEYLSKNKPAIHVAWRHNIEMTRAKTYLWCHDLVTSTVEGKKNFDKILCLTPFHKNYVMAKQGVDPEKIIVTRNGITPEKFDFERKEKDQNKIVWMSSPDRGLDRAMRVLDEVRKEMPDVQLHVYYGLENLYKYGMGPLADHLKQMMSERPWVIYHGFTEQNKMYREVSDAVVWLHPCNFIETFCITALEMLALGIFPITRKLGALSDTLRSAEREGYAFLLEHDCVTEKEISAYAEVTKHVLKEKLWEHIEFNFDLHDWSSVADEWVDFMNLEKKEEFILGKMNVDTTARGLQL